MRAELRIVLIGLLMGAAEIVPGVSGGTIAFISGIYERLVNGLKQFTPMLPRQLAGNSPGEIWKLLDATFLVTLFLAMGLSIMIFANVIGYMLENEPIAIGAFFFGLVLASCWSVGRQVEGAGFDTGVAIAMGVIIGISLTRLVPVDLEPTPVFLFFGGMIAVCAWILPGISGSFLLLLLGLYGDVIEVVKSLDIVGILCIGSGCMIGLVSFSRVLSYLLEKFRQQTLSLLVGFMLGSLLKLWPWKHTVSYQLNPDGSRLPLVEEQVLPPGFEAITGQDANLAIAALAAAGGCILVILLDRFASRSRNKTDE